MNTVRKYMALLLATVIFMSQAHAEQSLVPHKAEYKVKISGLSGRLNTELGETEDGYVARHVIKPTGFARVLSRGQMDVSSAFAVAAHGVRPARYSAIDGIRDDPPINLNFDWDSNTVAGTVGEDSVSLQWRGLSYDQVSIQYALMHDLLNDSVNSEYVLFDIDKMRTAKITKIDEKVFKTRAGKFTAIGIRHQKEGSSRQTTLWCVEELGFLPVVIEQHKSGRLKFRATLLSYQPTRAEWKAASSASGQP